MEQKRNFFHVLSLYITFFLSLLFSSEFLSREKSMSVLVIPTRREPLRRQLEYRETSRRDPDWCWLGDPTRNYHNMLLTFVSDTL